MKSTIDLSYNTIGATGAKALSQMPNIETLIISRYFIGYDNATIIFAEMTARGVTVYLV
ncbi:MAG: hypothetical protein V4489_04860 [Chlamydiota bacterium]